MKTSHLAYLVSGKIPIMNRIDIKDFSDWTKQVTQNDYKARHDFKQVGVIPDYVLNDKSVDALTPVNNEIHVSDHQLRHSVRLEKDKRGATLPIEILQNLPRKLEEARWYYDEKHKNICAVFDIKENDMTGKSVISINFFKGKTRRNSIVTSGSIKPEDMNNKVLFR